MINRNLLLKELSALDFMVVDLQMYLDLHPTDKTAIAQFNEVNKQADSVRSKYRELFSPVSIHCQSNPDKYKWIDSPWPWEEEFNYEI